MYLAKIVKKRPRTVKMQACVIKKIDTSHIGIVRDLAHDSTSTLVLMLIRMSEKYRALTEKILTIAVAYKRASF
jgi:hypothetical protein